MCNKENIKQIPYRKFPTLKLKLLKGIPIKLLNNIGDNLEKYKNIEDKDEILSDYLISACWLMHFDAFRKIGFFNERIFYAPEDVEYCIRCWLNEMKVVHLKKAEIIHIYQRISKKNLVSWINISHFKCLLYVLYKYRNFLRNRRKIGV
jgi:GT2 family glycosyltransferase